eukprot:COSAG01_NODE_11736_length_1870_cov_1.160926_1_plen_92_part_10
MGGVPEARRGYQWAPFDPQQLLLRSACPSSRPRAMLVMCDLAAERALALLGQRQNLWLGCFDCWRLLMLLAAAMLLLLPAVCWQAVWPTANR